MSAEAQLYTVWQEIALKYLRAGALDRGTGTPEIKAFEVEPQGRHYGTLLVRVEVGSVGDEGTAREMWRYRGLFAIGKRGGIRALTPRKGKKAAARRYPLIWGFTTFGDRA
jgi:hypothetical protein